MVWKKKGKEVFDERTYPEIMVDLETLDTEATAQVVSLGAVRFRMGTQDSITTLAQPGRTFYARLGLAEQEERGRDASADTLDWWSKQSDAARAVFDEAEESVPGVLTRFTLFCRGGKRIWGNGNMFDNAIMRDLYDDYGQTYPVGFSKDLDVRTLTWLWNFITNWGSNGKRPDVEFGTKHNALDDAKSQVLQVQKMILELKGSKYEP